ncbi:hypothetical protein EJ08DRAFT_519202 [Tothia fuscella]|uniref:Cytokinesis regulator n=1 Tax=Tothia fuscella TaxID=1048955 RepID=A0A9P4NH53_9PEZI|nr:hypothetical protein EJ08DRAFT_519202 [Tothia fuscella]
MATDVENWDDDADFAQGGELFGHSLSTQPTSFSSRMSIRSESLAADEDWQVLVTPDDESSKNKAIFSAKQVGIPIPQSVPQSALLGGAIKRLGKKKSKPKVSDDWGDDFDINDDSEGGLQLKLGGAPGAPATPSNNDDDFDTEWAEGSLGIRFGGTRRDTSNRGRSSSVSAMSPSMGSCMTFESEDDDLNGLVLPSEPIDFSAKLKQRQEKENEKELQEKKDSPTSAPVAQLQLPPRTPADDDDDLLSGLDFDGDSILDTKRTLNRNVKVENVKATPPPTRANITTITFTDKAPSRIPRPAGGSATKPYNLAPIHETGAHRAPAPPAPQFTRLNQQPRSTTTSAQLLRAKRSAPVLGRQSLIPNNSRPPVPFLPAGISNLQSQHIKTKTSQHFRQPSDHERPTSPLGRSFSRMSISDQSRPAPSRAGQRKEGYAPVPLLRSAVGRNTLTVPKRRQQFGSGNELDVFDDLPTSATKESKFIKDPVLKPKNPTLRRKNSHANLALGMPERSQMITPGPSAVPSTPLPPPTPRSGYFPPRTDNLPRFARDTAASRIAREQRTGNARPRSEGPSLVAPSNTNWKTQVALRSPHNSPYAARGKKKDAKGPMLIKNMTPGGPNVKNEKGMVFNAILQRWEGNEHVLSHFSNPSTTTLPLHPTHKDNFSHHHHTSSIPSGLALGLRDQNTLPRHGSPPRPALISQVNGMKGPRIERGMVFDPDRMKWLKVDPRSLANNFESNQLTPGSVSIDDEEDPFAGIDDLPDEKSKIAPGAGGANKENESGTGGDWALGEEFDLGPTFIRRQQSEEKEWRKWTEKWFAGAASNGQVAARDGGEEWKWAIRRVAERS